MVLFSTLLYRTATGMGPLAILVTVTGRQSLAVASVALTCWTLAGAAGQPAWVASCERWGHGRTLASLGVLTAAFHASVGLVHGPALTVGAATLAGLTLPPVTAKARALLAELLPGPERERAFSTESALASLAFVIAPLIVGASRALVEMGPVLASGALLVSVSLLYVRVGRGAARIGGGPEVAANSGEPDDRSPADAPRTASQWLPAVILVAAGGACYGMLACIEVAVVARFHDPTAAASMLCGWSLASLLGGLGATRWIGVHWVRWAVLAVSPVAYFLMAAFGMHSGVVFAAVLALSGIAVSPTLGLITSQLAQVTHRAIRPSAFAWLQSSSWIGASAATTAAGLLATTRLDGVLVLAGVLALAVLAALSLSGRGGTSEIR